MAIEENVVKELLKPIERLVNDLYEVLERYNNEETDPQRKAENDDLIRRTQKARHIIGEVLYELTLRRLSNRTARS